MNRETKDCLYRFEDRVEHRFKDEQVLSCYLGKVCHHTCSRYARGNLSLLYDGSDSISLDLSCTHKKIDFSRKKGSRWIINELPAIVLVGEKTGLIIVEINEIKNWPFQTLAWFKKGSGVVAGTAGGMASALRRHDHAEPRAWHPALQLLQGGAECE